MTDILLTRDECNKVVGFRERDKRAWARLRKKMNGLELGELLVLRYWFPRNGVFHKLHMKLLRSMFNSQEAFENEKQFRYWTEIGAGHCDWVPGQAGLIPVPKSIAFDNLDDEGLRIVHEDTKKFFRGEYAQRVMWPHLSLFDRSVCVEAVVSEFEKES